ncbi:hypothetical protein HPB51_021522 [Rhipicephalus microplus]|uniref:Uncharacterized protein n=1 Tax=Rhipicephalus microplus TaxID=6941 RepID=A0A9J6DJI2_RHIMP|nr:hypothetical protein HPB51_021522 [Rhipicephalus microplus]
MKILGASDSNTATQKAPMRGRLVYPRSATQVGKVRQHHSRGLPRVPGVVQESERPASLETLSVTSTSTEPVGSYRSLKITMPKNAPESSPTNSPEEIYMKETLLPVSAVLQPPAESGSVRPGIQAMQLSMSTVKSTPRNDPKEAPPKVMQSLLGPSELTPRKSMSRAKNNVLQPVMEPSLKLREILVGQKVLPRLQPLLQWPPDPLLGKELAARIQVEKEAFSKACGVVFKPGRTLKTSIARRVSEHNCACPSTDEAIDRHDECKAENSKTVVHIDATADDIKKEQEPGDISPEAVDIKEVVYSHEKPQTEEVVYVETIEQQQELSVQASVSEVMSRNVGDTVIRDGFFPQPPTNRSGLRECKLNKRCSAAQVRETTGSLKKIPGMAEKGSTGASSHTTKRGLLASC